MKFKAGDKVCINKEHKIINIHVFHHDVIYIVEEYYPIGHVMKVNGENKKFETDSIKYKGIEGFFNTEHNILVSEDFIEDKSWGV